MFKQLFEKISPKGPQSTYSRAASLRTTQTVNTHDKESALSKVSNALVKYSTKTRPNFGGLDQMNVNLRSIEECPKNYNTPEADLSTLANFIVHIPKSRAEDRISSEPGLTGGFAMGYAGNYAGLRPVTLLTDPFGKVEPRNQRMHTDRISTKMIDLQDLMTVTSLVKKSIGVKPMVKEKKLPMIKSAMDMQFTSLIPNKKRMSIKSSQHWKDENVWQGKENKPKLYPRTVANTLRSNMRSTSERLFTQPSINSSDQDVFDDNAFGTKSFQPHSYRVTSEVDFCALRAEEQKKAVRELLRFRAQTMDLHAKQMQAELKQKIINEQNALARQNQFNRMVARTSSPARSTKGPRHIQSVVPYVAKSSSAAGDFIKQVASPTFVEVPFLKKANTVSARSSPTVHRTPAIQYYTYDTEFQKKAVFPSNSANIRHSPATQTGAVSTTTKSTSTFESSTSKAPRQGSPLTSTAILHEKGAKANDIKLASDGKFSPLNTDGKLYTARPMSSANNAINTSGQSKSKTPSPMSVTRQPTPFVWDKKLEYNSDNSTRRPRRKHPKGCEPPNSKTDSKPQFSQSASQSSRTRMSQDSTTISSTTSQVQKNAGSHPTQSQTGVLSTIPKSTSTPESSTSNASRQNSSLAPTASLHEIRAKANNDVKPASDGKLHTARLMSPLNIDKLQTAKPMSPANNASNTSGQNRTPCPMPVSRQPTPSTSTPESSTSNALSPLKTTAILHEKGAKANAIKPASDEKLHAARSMSPLNTDGKLYTARPMSPVNNSINTSGQIKTPSPMPVTRQPTPSIWDKKLEYNSDNSTRQPRRKHPKGCEPPNSKTDSKPQFSQPASQTSKPFMSQDSKNISSMTSKVQQNASSRLSHIDFINRNKKE